MRLRPHLVQRLRRAKPDRLAELRARVTEAAAKLEAGAARLTDYETLVRVAGERQTRLAGELADALADLHVEEVANPLIYKA